MAGSGGLPAQAHLRRHVGSILDCHRIREMFMQVVNIFAHPRRKESGGVLMPQVKSFTWWQLLKQKGRYHNEERVDLVKAWLITTFPSTSVPRVLIYKTKQCGGLDDMNQSLLN